MPIINFVSVRRSEQRRVLDNILRMAKKFKFIMVGVNLAV